MGTPYTYLTRWHTTEEFEQRRREWFRRKRALELVGVGFLSARAYKADAFPNGCNLYEIDDFSIFDTEEYKSLRTDDPFVAEIWSDFTYNFKTFYEQIVVVGGEGACLDPVPSLSGGAISLLYFDASDPDEVSSWFGSHVVGTSAEGVRSFRLWRQIYEHPRPTQREAKWCAVIEWATTTFDDGSILRAAASSGAIEVSRSDVLRKWYGLEQFILTKYLVFVWHHGEWSAGRSCHGAPYPLSR